jgi:hypothetical protein
LKRKKFVPAPNTYTIKVEEPVRRKIYAHDRTTIFEEKAKNAKREALLASPFSYDPNPLF